MKWWLGLQDYDLDKDDELHILWLCCKDEREPGKVSYIFFLVTKPSVVSKQESGWTGRIRH